MVLLSGRPAIGVAQVATVEITLRFEFDGLFKHLDRFLVVSSVKSYNSEIRVSGCIRSNRDRAPPQGGGLVELFRVIVSESLVVVAPTIVRRQLDNTLEHRQSILVIPLGHIQDSQVVVVRPR